MAIKINNENVVDDDKNINAGVVTATDINIPPRVLSFSPSDGATDQDNMLGVTLTFNQFMSKGSGFVTFRYNSGVGTVIQSISVASTNVDCSGVGRAGPGVAVTITPTAYLPDESDIYLEIPSGAFVNQFNNPYIGTDTYNFVSAAQTTRYYSPGISSTGITVTDNIVLGFRHEVQRGSGTINLRKDSAVGTIVESYNASSSDRISVAGTTWTLDPTSSLLYNTDYYLEMPAEAVIGFPGLNVSGGITYSFTTIPLALGDAYEGGFLVCQTGGVRWVIAPCSTQVIRSWGNRSNAVTCANASGCSGTWFVPNCTQLGGLARCKVYWDYVGSFQCSCGSHTVYWSNTQFNTCLAVAVCVGCGPSGSVGCIMTSQDPSVYNHVRAFRCVTY